MVSTPASLKVTRSSSRHLPDPEDDQIYLETNRRSLGFSIKMARELRDALTAVLDGGERVYVNEAARLIDEQEAARERALAARAGLDDGTTFEDLFS